MHLAEGKTTFACPPRRRPRPFWGRPSQQVRPRTARGDAWCVWEPLEARRLFAAWDVALIDSTLDRPDLIAAAANGGTRVIYFDGANESAGDVIQRVTQLADDTGWRVRSVSIFSHGTSGAFALGKDVISAATLEQTADAWRDLGRVTADDADIYLYGCSVTSEFSGQKLLTDLAELTGADVFGSNDLTGRGGDWVLESASLRARRNRVVVFDLAKLSAYSATLAAPVVTMTGGSAAYTENGAAIFVDATLGLTDADGVSSPVATVTISGNYANGQDVLAFTDTARITGSWNAATGVMTLTGNASATIGNMRNALRTVTYVNTSDNPSTSDRTVSIVVNDGADNSNTGTRTITVAAVNDIPSGTTTGSTLAYTENAGAVVVDSGYTVTDVDNANLASATVSIVTNFASAEDTLAFTNQNGITGSYNSGTGVLTLTGSSTVANYQAALRSVTYTNSSDAPSTLNRTIRFIVNDGTANSAAANRTMSVTAVNDAPVLTPDPSALSYTENDGAIALDSGLTVSDPDNANLSSATITISANYVNGEDTLSFTNQGGITGSWNAGTGVLTLTGSATKGTYQTALRSITYTNSSENPSALTRTVSFAANDGAATGTPTTRGIAITAVNDAPTLTGTGGSVGHTEGTPVVVDGGVTVGDADNTNIASATITISAGRVAGDILNFTDQNGITGSFSSFTGTLTLSGSATLAQYQTALRSITFSTGDDPGSGTRTISFDVNDGAANSNTVTRDVTVTPVNDAPVLSAVEGSALAFTEGDAATVVTATVALADVDDTNIEGATIQISANYVNGEDTLSFTNTANITGSWNAGTGTLTLSGTETVANYQAALRSVQYGNGAARPTTAARTIAFTTNDGSVNSNTVTRSVTVASVNDAPVWTVPGAQATNEDTALVFSSGNGNLISVADSDDGAAELSITLTATNGTITLSQTTGLTFSVGDGAADATMTFTGTSANANGALAGLSFAPAQDFNGAASLAVSVDDQGNTGSGGALTDSESVAITVNSINDAPVLSGIEGGALAYTEDDAATASTSSIAAVDVDLTNLAGATVQITGNYQNGQDVLGFTNTANITGSWNAGTGTMTLTGSATVAEYQAALRSVTYQNTSQTPNTSTRTVSFSVNDGTLNSNTATRDIAVSAVNDAPTVANPIADQTATEDAAFSYQFALNVFDDLDGDSLAYAATLSDGSVLPAWLSFNAATRTFSGTPTNGDVGTIAVRVTASDGNGGSVNDTFSVTVSNTNDAPIVANAVPDQSATEDTAFSYQFPSNTFNDVDAGDTLSYTATLSDGSALPAWLSFNAATRTFSGTPANADVGAIAVRVTADDGNGGTVNDTFSVTVTNANDAPTVANAISDQNATEDNAFSFQFAANTFSDVDVSDTLTFSATLGDGSALPAWLSFNAATRTFSGTPLNGDVGTIAVRVTASDGNGGSVNDTFSVTIANTNDAPTVPNPIADQNATEDTAFNFQFAPNTFNDVDAGDTLTYVATRGDGSALPAWLSFDGATRTFSGTPLNGDVGTVTVRVTADDGNAGTVNDTFTITVANTNDAPTVANPIPDQNATEDAPFSHQFAANVFDDADGDALSFSATLADGSALPAWLTFSAATRTFSGTPANGDVGMHSVRVTASDGNGGSVNDTFTITVANTNDAPTVANPVADQNATEDVLFNYALAADVFSDVDASDSPTYTATHSDGSALPAWLTFNAATRTFSGTPGNADVGAIAIRVTADDGNGGSVSDTFAVTVANANDAPTVANPIPGQGATEDAAFSYAFPANTFADIDAGDTLTYSAQLAGGGALPSWLSFDTATRTFSGTPANGDVGTVSVDVIADDGNGGMVTDTFNITIANVNDAPTVANPIADQSGTQDVFFSLQFPRNTFNDVDAGDTIAYSATLADGSALPAWLSFNAATRTLSGTPTNADIGGYSVRVTASDGNGGSASDTFTLTVNNTNDAPTVANPIADQNATEDAAFGFQFASNTFADGDGDPLTYTATRADGSALPAWLNFDAATRTFSGTPANGDVGTLSVRVTANDEQGGSVSDTFAVLIANTNDAPTVANAIPDQSAPEDAPFSYQFPLNTFDDVDAADTLVYVATLADGSALPAWLSFNAATRTFSGTPVNGDVGAYPIRVTASDGSAATASDTFTITVGNTNDAPTLVNPIADRNATEDVLFSFQFAANTFNDVDAMDTLGYSATLSDGSALPAWLSFDAATRTFSGTPANGDVGAIAVRVTANDGNGGTVTDTFAITTANVNDAPTVSNPIPDQGATEDVAFSYQFAANAFNDVDAGDTLTYGATLADGSALPAWLSFNAATRTFSGTPANDDTGGYSVRVTASDANGGSVTDTFTVTVSNTNDAPTVANPIGPQAATEDALFSFQFPVNTFSDADGDVLTYTATQSDGSALPAWITFNAATRTFSGTPVNMHVGAVTVRVTASDGNGGSVANTFSITIANANDAPTVINPIADQGATEDAAFSFQFANNTFDDVDAGDSLSYTVTLADGSALPAWLSFDAASRTFSGTPLNANVGAIAIRVTAADGNGGSVSDTFTLTVANVNDGPTLANPVPDQNATEDALFAYQFPSNTFAEIDAGDTLTYSATLSDGSALPAWLSFNTTTRTFSGTAANGDVGTIAVRITANDGNGGTVNDTFSITVANTNDGPTVANPIADQSATEDAPFNYQFPANTFADVDAGAALAYTATLDDGSALPAWLTFDAATRTFSGTPANAEVGLVTVRVTADDGNGASASDTFTLTVANTNDTPTVANPIPDRTATEDAPFTFQFAANAFNDVDAGDSLSYTSTLGDGSALPAWLTFNAATRTFSGTPANGDVGSFVVRVTATDGSGATASDTFSVTVVNTNDAPTVVNPIADQAATEDSPFTHQFPLNTFGDDDGDALTYSATRSDGSAHPAWLVFNAATRTFSGTPANEDVGPITIRVTANDGQGGMASDTFTVTVANTNDAPTLINAEPDVTASEDGSFSYQVPAAAFEDVDGDALTYSATMADGSPLPAWLTFDPTTRTFTGTPTNAQIGSYPVRVRASDGSGTFADDTFTIAVVNTNDAPFAQGPFADQVAIEDGAFNYAIPPGAFTDEESDPLVYNAVLDDGSSLPDWLHFDADSRTFSGSPPDGAVGAIVIRVRVMDGHGGTASATFSLTVSNVNDAPTTAASVGDVTAVQGRPFQLPVPPGAFTDVDDDALELTATLADGSPLPAWLTFDGRNFAGTPQAGEAGMLAIRLTARDAAGATASDVFSITVLAATSSGEPDVRVRAKEAFASRLPDRLLRELQRDVDRLGLRYGPDVALPRVLAASVWKPLKIRVTPGTGILPAARGDAHASGAAELAETGADTSNGEPPADGAEPIEEPPPEDGAEADVDAAEQSSAVSHPQPEAAVLGQGPGRLSVVVNAGAKAMRDFTAGTITNLLSYGCLALRTSNSARTGRLKAPKKFARDARR